MQLRSITRREAVRRAHQRQNCPNGTLPDDARELHAWTFRFVNDELGHVR